MCHKIFHKKGCTETETVLGVYSTLKMNINIDKNIGKKLFERCQITLYPFVFSNLLQAMLSVY